MGSGADDGDGDEVQDTQQNSFISFLTLFLPLIPYSVGRLLLGLFFQKSGIEMAKRAVTKTEPGPQPKKPRQCSPSWPYSTSKLWSFWPTECLYFEANETVGLRMGIVILRQSSKTKAAASRRRCVRGPAIVNPTAGAWKTRILDQAFWCGWRLCSVPIESWAAGGPVQGAAWAHRQCGWFVLVVGAS